MLRIVLASLWLVASVAARDPGDGGIEVKHSDGSVVESSAVSMSFDATGFSCTSQATGEVLCTLSTIVTQAGTCIGDVNTELCSTVIMDGRTLKLDAVTGITWASPLVLDTPIDAGSGTTHKFNDQVDLWNSDTAASGAVTIYPFLKYDGGTSISGALANLTFIYVNGTTTDTASGTFSLFRNDGIYRRTTTTNGAATTTVYDILSAPDVRADGVTLTSGTIIGLSHTPILSVANSGVMSGVVAYGLSSGLTVGASTTAADRYGLYVANATGAGAVTNQYGVHCTALAKGGTLDACLSSAVAAGTGQWFLYDTGGADSTIKGELRLGDNTAPTNPLEILGKYTVNTSGIVSEYNDIATVSNGVPSILGQVNLTAQSAALTTATLYTPATTGMFRVSFVCTLTRAATTSSVLCAGVNLNYTTGDGATAVVQNVPLLAQGATTAFVDIGSTANTIGTTLIGELVVYASTAAMTYDVSYTSVGGTTMQYAVRMRVEAL